MQKCIYNSIFIYINVFVSYSGSRFPKIKSAFLTYGHTLETVTNRNLVTNSNLENKIETCFLFNFN